METLVVGMNVAGWAFWLALNLWAIREVWGK